MMEEPELLALSSSHQTVDDTNTDLDMGAKNDVEANEASIEDEDELFERFEPSISDRLQVGYSNMDRACQTEFSEIVNLKQTADVLGTVVNDLSVLKRSLYFAKLTLQAEYNSRLEEVTLELHARVKERLAEIEANHEERVEVVRKSYKTQLSNALCKLSKEYHDFYGNKDIMAEAAYKQKIKDMQNHQEIIRKNELAQMEMFEMLKIQIDEESKEENVPSGKSSVLSAALYLEEIDELNKSLKDYESRIDYLEDALDKMCAENKILSSNLDEVNMKHLEEEKRRIALDSAIESLNNKMEIERQYARNKLEEQRQNLKRVMKNKMTALESKFEEETDKQLEITRNMESERLKHQKEKDELRIKQLIEKHEQEKVVEPPKDTDDMSRLRKIEESQRAEIIRLNKEIERINQLSEMKVKILNEHVHSLKDEMFLRTTLQRQTARLKQAKVTYVKRGNTYHPLGVNPVGNPEITRKLQLPNLVGAPQENPPRSIGNEKR